MKKGAIFDMDGVLFDTERLYQQSWMLLAEEMGLEPNPAFPKAVCGTNGAYMLDIIRKYYPSADAQAYMQGCLNRVAQIVETAVPEKEGVHEILAYLHQNKVKIAVASSSPLETIKHHLHLSGIFPYFDAIVSGEQVAHGKPAPDIFLEAAAQLNLPAKDCYVFEDGINGIHAGIAAGCTTVMIPDLTEPTEALYQLCSAVYPSLTAVQNALETGDL